MPKGYFLEKGVIVIERELTTLDMFVKKFIDVLKKHSDYLVVSGFVSICTGRVRGTEDVDVLVPLMDRDKFEALFKDLEKNGFWCYQGDNPSEAYENTRNLDNIRFALKNEVFPNIEFITFNDTKKAKSFEFNHPQGMRIGDFEFKIPQIEFEILYKEIILAGKKDIDDAKHLRTFFLDILSEDKFKEYEEVIRSDIE